MLFHTYLLDCKLVEDSNSFGHLFNSFTGALEAEAAP